MPSCDWSSRRHSVGIRARGPKIDCRLIPGSGRTACGARPAETPCTEHVGPTGTWLASHLHHGCHSSTSSRLLSAVACPNMPASSEVALSVLTCAAVEQCKCHGKSVSEVIVPGALGERHSRNRVLDIAKLPERGHDTLPGPPLEE